jgi:uncharacterized lipoprotein YmbA
VPILALLSACSLLPESAPVHLFALDTVPSAETAPCAVSFSLRDIRLAGHLDRQEVIVARQGSELVASGNELWAAPLKREFARVLTGTLLSRWSGSVAIAHPWRQGEVPRLALNVDVDRLEPVADQLRATIRWTLVEPAAKSRVLDGGSFDTSVPMSARGAAPTVQAIDRAIGRFGDLLAKRARAAPALREACQAAR